MFSYIQISLIGRVKTHCPIRFLRFYNLYDSTYICFKLFIPIVVCVAFRFLNKLPDERSFNYHVIRLLETTGGGVGAGGRSIRLRVCIFDHIFVRVGPGEERAEYPRFSK